MSTILKAISVKEVIKGIVRLLLPLTARKHMAIWVNNQKWIGSKRRNWWSLELIRDLAKKNINEYHKFLWFHHLGYAAPYEVNSRFGLENMEQSRKYFFSDLRSHLIQFSVAPNKDIRSVFEVGCSLGYQLRYMEMDLFPLAGVLEGIDIDKYAIRAGSEYLKSIGSKVRLRLGDMEELSNFIEGKAYDVIVCSGVLMYLNEQTATRVVHDMLRHTHVMLAISGPAHPSADNCQLQHSVPRVHDGAFIHNIDDMVKRAGGRILARRWEGGNMVGGHTIYFIFATRQ